MNVMAVLDRFANVVLPAELWDGSNPYCRQPGRVGSAYAADLKALCEARAAVAELIEAMERIAARAKPHPDDTDADRKRDLYHIEAIASMALARIGAD